MPHGDLRGVTSHGSRFVEITKTTKEYPDDGQGTATDTEADSEILGKSIVLDFVRFHGTTDDLLVRKGTAASTFVTISNTGIGYEAIDIELEKFITAQTSYGFMMSGTTDDAAVGYRILNP